VPYHPEEQAEAPAAVVVPVDGRSPPLEELRADLPDQGTTESSLPERLELVDVPPRDPQGKVDTRSLRARIDDEG
jgi:non-ribosomal peptide synthetase component E (peptide arylation enzyme)